MAKLVLVVTLLMVTSAHAGVGEHLPVPAPFDALGLGPIALGDVLDPGAPIVLVVSDRLRLLDAVATAQAAQLPHQIVVITTDPTEPTADAYQAHAAVLAALGGGNIRRVLYLRGEQASIDAVAAAVGIDARHPAAVALVSPQGRVEEVLGSEDRRGDAGRDVEEHEGERLLLRCQRSRGASLVAVSGEGDVRQ